MTRGQLVAMFAIAGLAAVAFWQSNEVARYFRARGVDLSAPVKTTI